MKRCKNVVAIIAIVLGLIALFSTRDEKESPPYNVITEDASVFENKFYYEQLSEEEQFVYQEIYQGILEEQKEIYVHSTDAKKVNEILKNIIYDFPEVFWVDGGAMSTTYEETDLEEGYTVLEPVYTYTSEERVQKAQEIEVAAEEIISQIPSESDEYGKIKYIYEVLINSVSYVENAPDSQNLYSALVGKQTVCAGYAKANQYLLNKMGIYCTYVTGTIVENGVSDNHAWNIVKCNGNYYYVDVTWADPLVQGEKSIPSEMIYDYLCCSEMEVADTHTLMEGYVYPECVSDDLNYYRMNHMFYETVDKEQLLNVIYETIDAKEASTTFKFANNALYQEGKDVIHNQLIASAIDYLHDKYGLQEMEYYYEEHDTLNKLVIYWSYE